MGYPLSLDERDEQKLIDELVLRRTRRSNGLCDYCGREPDTPPCKFPGRHHGALVIREQDMAALAEVGEELKRARTKFQPFNSAHEGYSVILEEVEELWEIVRMKKQHRTRSQMREEAIQVAAMGIRFASDICPVGQDANDEQS